MPQVYQKYNLESTEVRIFGTLLNSLKALDRMMLRSIRASSLPWRLARRDLIGFSSFFSQFFLSFRIVSLIVFDRFRQDEDGESLRVDSVTTEGSLDM